MGDTSGAVLAGSPAFTSALVPALQVRFGNSLLVNPDPDAVARAAAPVLLVVEYSDERWLPALERVRAARGPSARILVALPQACAADWPRLRPLVDFAYPAERGAAPVLGALARLAAGQPAAPAPAPPAAAQPAPAPVAAPRATPVLTPIPGGLRAAPARPATTPAPGAWRTMTAGAGPGNAAVALASAPPAAPDPLDDVFAAVAEDAPQPDPFASAVEAPTLPPFAGTAASSGNWPGTVPSGADAEQVLASAIVGMAPEDDAALEAVLASLGDVERAAVLGDPVPVDGDAVRTAAVLRYRVAVALASVPAPGTPVDAEAAGALLAELDAALAALKAAADAAPDRAAPLEALRRALVKEAVDLSEAIHRAAPPDAPPPARPLPAPRARIVAVHEGAGDDVPRARKGPLVALVLAIAAAAAFHGWSWWSQQQTLSAASMPDAPEGLVGRRAAAGGAAVLVGNGRPVDRAALDAFRAQQEAKGMQVKELPGGTVIVVPARPGAPKAP